MLPPEGIIDGIVHPVVTFPFAFFPHGRCYLLEQVSVLPFDFGELVFLLHQFLVLVESWWFPVEIATNRSDASQSLVMTLDLFIDLPLPQTSLSSPHDVLHI